MPFKKIVTNKDTSKIIDALITPEDTPQIFKKVTDEFVNRDNKVYQKFSNSDEIEKQLKGEQVQGSYFTSYENQLSLRLKAEKNNSNFNIKKENIRSFADAEDFSIIINEAIYEQDKHKIYNEKKEKVWETFKKDYENFLNNENFNELEFFETVYNFMSNLKSQLISREHLKMEYEKRVKERVKNKQQQESIYETEIRQYFEPFIKTINQKLFKNGDIVLYYEVTHEDIERMIKLNEFNDKLTEDLAVQMVNYITKPVLLYNTDNNLSNIMTIMTYLTSNIYKMSNKENFIVLEEVKAGSAQAGSNTDVWDETIYYYPHLAVIASVTPQQGLGFFPKKFPDDEYLNYNFNSNTKDLFCIISALTFSAPTLFDFLNKNTFREKVYQILADMQLQPEQLYKMNEKKLMNFYRYLILTYKLNCEIILCRPTKEYKGRMEYRNLKKNNVFRESKNPHYTDGPKLYVFKMKEHVFNITPNKGVCKLVDIHNYLNKIYHQYDTLEDFSLNTENERRKISRRTVMEFNEFNRNNEKNPYNYVKDINQFNIDNFIGELKPAYKPTQIGVDTIKTGRAAVSAQEKATVMYYDFETNNLTNLKIIPYSYYIIQNDQKFYYFNKSKCTFTIITSFFDNLITLAGDATRINAFAHNGSRYDVQILMEILFSHNFTAFNVIKCKSIDVESGDLISFEVQIYVKATKQTLSISFRDSWKILNCKAADISENYEIPEVKMPYPYEFMNRLMTKYHETDMSVYKLLNSAKIKDFMIEFVKENGNREDMKKTLEFIEEYDKFLESTIESKEIKEDIDNYKKYLEDKKLYFAPEQYTDIYNKYDVILIQKAMQKMNYYLHSMESEESINNFIKASYDNKVKKIMETYTDGAAVSALQELDITIEKFKERKYEPIPSIKQIDVEQERTCAGIVFKICVNHGVFQNIHSLKGSLKTFFNCAVVGGRVMLHTNKNQYDTFKSKYLKELEELENQPCTPEKDLEIMQMAYESSIVDFDAVSLYPSAIFQCRMPAGKPMIMHFNRAPNTQKIYEYLKKQNIHRFYICCDIHTRKDLEFPLLSEKIDGRRTFRNGEFKQIVIGDIALREAQIYQDAVVTHIYCIVGFNRICNRYSRLIETLFNLRYLFKKLGNKTEQTLKLLMNSSYGRTILKTKMYETEYYDLNNSKDKITFQNRLRRDYAMIKPDFQLITNFVKIKRRRTQENINEDSGYPHVGVHILERSKNIMTKAFDLIYKSGGMVYMQDTDSCHINAHYIEHLKPIIGEEMAQFHSDFDVDKKNGESAIYTNVEKYNLMGAFSIESYFVAKKTYYDRIFLKKDGKYHIKEHMRAKGVHKNLRNRQLYINCIEIPNYEKEINFSDATSFRPQKAKNGGLVNNIDLKKTFRRT